MAKAKLTTDNIGKYCRPFCKRLSRKPLCGADQGVTFCVGYDAVIYRDMDLGFFIRCQPCIDGGDGLEWTPAADARCYETVDPGSGGGQ